MQCLFTLSPLICKVQYFAISTHNTAWSASLHNSTSNNLFSQAVVLLTLLHDYTTIIHYLRTSQSIHEIA